MNTLELQTRDLKQKTKDLRTKGLIPGVLYGPGIDHQLVTIPSAVLERSLDMTGEVYEVKSKGRTCFVKFDEVQRTPVKNKILHFSLLQMPKGVENEIDVPVHIMGEAQGVKDGGVLVTLKDILTVSCSPKNMPSTIEVDISDLRVGEHITVKDLQHGKDFTISGEPDDVVVMCKPVSLDQEIDNEESPVSVEGDEGPIKA